MSEENKNNTEHNFDPTMFDPIEPVKRSMIITLLEISWLASMC